LLGGILLLVCGRRVAGRPAAATYFLQRIAELLGSVRYGGTILLAIILATASLGLASCSVPIADLPVVGVPEGAPARPKDPGAFPAVHDMPAAREQPALAPAEQAKIESELAAARDRQSKAAADANAADAPKQGQARN